MDTTPEGTTESIDSAATRATYDWSTIRPSTAVIETIAAHADRDAVDVEPLYNTIDPDGLDAIVRSNHKRAVENSAVVQFQHTDHHIAIYSDGVLTVRSEPS